MLSRDSLRPDRATRTILGNLRRAGIGMMLALLLAACLPCGCGKSQSAGESQQETARVEEAHLGPVTLTFVIDPPRVHLDRDVLLTMRITAPGEIEIAAPDFSDRLEGFDLSGFFASEPLDAAGKITREYHARLTPLVAERYRLAPMAIEYTDRSQSPASTGWLATRPIDFESASLPKGTSVEPILDPLWIRPSFTTVLIWVLATAALVFLCVLLWKLSRRVHREIQLRRMSPRERAMHELEELLARDLIGHNRVKDFYVELTMVVRRYIERRHGVRAPEQTTEEFLVAVQQDQRFGATVVTRLREFLQAADLVKFAAYRPDRGAIDHATTTARDYIETDDATASAAEVANTHGS